MKQKEIKIIEDIFPLTIINRRYGGFAILQADNDTDCVDSLSSDEEYLYNPHYLMNINYSFVNYGIGKTISEAFEDFKKRYADRVERNEK